MNKVLFDTNAFSRYFAGDEQLLDILSRAETIYLSVFVLGELYAGFAGGRRQAENQRMMQQFMNHSTVVFVPATEETASVFAFVKNTLKNTGHPLPINDIWIAAHTLETGSVLITFDRHFAHVPGLRHWPEL